MNPTKFTVLAVVAHRLLQVREGIVYLQVSLAQIRQSTDVRIADILGSLEGDYK